MEFFVRHYEKLLLAICLIGLCFAIWQVNENKKNNLAGAREQKMTATEKAQIKGEKAVEPLDVAKLPTFDAIIHAQHSYADGEGRPARIISENQVTLTPTALAKGAPIPFPPKKDPNAPGILDIGRLAFCTGCSHVIPFNAAAKEGYKCPYCNVAIADVARATTPEDDLDQDGIPDLFEQEHAKIYSQNGTAGNNTAANRLNYRWPHDALMDFDGDGFLNIEEYEYFTKELKIKSDEAAACLNDAVEHPPLARLLYRTAKPARRDTLPFTLFRVKNHQAVFLRTQNGKVITWKPSPKAVPRVDSRRQFPVRLDPKDKKPVTIPLGGGRYLLVSVDVARGVAVVQDRESKEQYTLKTPADEKSINAYDVKNDERPILEFIFLDNRNREGVGTGAMRRLTERQIQGKWKEASNVSTADVDAPGPVDEPAAPPRRTVRRRAAEDAGMDNRAGTNITGSPVVIFDLHIAKDGTLITLQKQAAADGGQGGSGLDTEFYRISGNDTDGIFAQELENNNGAPGNPVGDPLRIPVFDKEKLRYLPAIRTTAEDPMR